MKVLHALGAGVPASKFHTMGLHFSAELLMKQLHENGHTIDLVCNNSDGRELEYTRNTFHSPDVYAYKKKLHERVNKVVGEHDYDVVHMHYGIGDMKYLVQIMDNHPEPAYTVTMNTTTEVSSDLDYRYREEYEEFLSHDRVAMVSPCRYYRDYHQELFGEMPQICHVYLGIPELDIDIPDEKIWDWIVVGRLASEKNVKRSIQAALHITDGNVVYVGQPDSEDESDYVEETRELILNNSRIDWCPELSNRELRTTLMPRCKYNISLCQTETYGLTVAEGANAGLPCLAFPGGGVSELIEHHDLGAVCDGIHRKWWKTRLKMLKNTFEEEIKPRDWDHLGQLPYPMTVEGCAEEWERVYSRATEGWA